MADNGLSVLIERAATAALWAGRREAGFMAEAQGLGNRIGNRTAVRSMRTAGDARQF
jgi:hypothetical protein